MNARQPIIIKSVKEILFLLREELYIPDPNKLIKIELYHNIGVNKDIKHVKFKVGVFIHYEGSNEKLATMEINNFYELPLMDEYQKEENNVILPGEVLLKMVGESIAHLRVLFIQKLAGTPYQQIIIPYEDPHTITAYFFPTLIKNKEGEMSLKGVLED